MPKQIRESNIKMYFKKYKNLGLQWNVPGGDLLPGFCEYCNEAPGYTKEEIY
jgi:hypothetical protein